ncbi:uncharacterized protein LOC113296422 [Papaver somniferum]|uniref:uncharacterized protein LOC113296422 n=1 Tax=Papaver somniferum TaxID=3469 RepID=UPI000E6FE0FD|nr:uncharacterized protein LOC113296422 [Papaver somniferum]
MGGINNINRRDVIRKKVKQWKTTILVLKETKIQECNKVLAKQIWDKRSVKWVDAPSEGRSGGILCFWDEDKLVVEEVVIGIHSISLRCKFINSDFTWMFTGVYGPANPLDRKDLWRELEEIRSLWQLPWVLGGDFNKIRFMHERTSETEISTGMRRFNRFIVKYDLVDLPLNGDSFTWNNKNQVNNIRSRIDRIVVSSDWEEKFPAVIQIALPIPCSDHCPVAPIREGSAGFIFAKKIQILKFKLKTWSKIEFGDVDRKLEDLEEEFMHLDMEEETNGGLTEEQCDKRVLVQQNYCSIIGLVAEKWRARSRVDFLQNNDKNTKLFHKIASDRRRNHINKIKVDGRMTQEDKEIKKGIVNHFKKIFQDKPLGRPVMGDLKFIKIDEDMKQFLEQSISENEVYNAIKALGKTKASGTDGFQVLFYLKVWEIIKFDFMKVIHELQESGVLDWRFKNTL